MNSFSAKLGKVIFFNRMYSAFSFQIKLIFLLSIFCVFLISCNSSPETITKTKYLREQIPRNKLIDNGKVLPVDAIFVGEGLFLVPIGTDEDNCPLFKLFSYTEKVLAVIYYINTQGIYVINKDEAKCR